MTDFLAKLFVKHYKDTENPSVRKSYGTLSGIVGICVNALLSVIKLTVGFLSGSIAITADALNNLSDAGSSVITIVSFKISARPADREHPFGHARIEYIASLIISFLILLVGFEMISDSIASLISFKIEDKKLSVFTTVVLSLSVIMKLWLALFYRKIGKRINSAAVLASSTDSLFDAISTFGVLACTVIIHFTGWVFLDAVFGIVISVFILIAGIRILNETKNSLLGEAPVNETVEKIKSIVDEYPEVLGIHDLMVHNYGPGHFIASFHAEVDGEGDIYALHDTIDNIERRINTELNILATIHLDPILIGNPIVDELREMLIGIIREISPDISMHDFRAVIGTTHTNLIFDIVLPFESKYTPDGIIEEISRAVKSKNDSCYCVITVDRG